MARSCGKCGRCIVICVLLVGSIFHVDADNNTTEPYYTLKLVDGVFYGPGSLADAPMPAGTLGHIRFVRPLNGETEYYNNGPALPNIDGEANLKKTVDGRASNGLAINEYLDGGIVDVGRGAMRYLSIVVNRGRRAGRQFYILDKVYDWRIESDMTLDPGFPEGVITPENMVITTGLVWARRSLQNMGDISASTDRAGSLAAGTPLIGRLGDYDYDGCLDGVIVGVANIPLGHIFLPGSPVAQSRRFVSDIPISHYDAAFLTITSVHNFAAVWNVYAKRGHRDTDATQSLRNRMVRLLDEVVDRLGVAMQHLVETSGSLQQSHVAQAARRRVLVAHDALNAAALSISSDPLNNKPVSRMQSEIVAGIFREIKTISKELETDSGLTAH